MSEKKYDIFLSYSRLDKERVTPLVAAFQKQGWTVWWDPKIPDGKTFDRYIEERLEESKVVVVVWSKNSIQSDWVRAEANEGREKGVLVPLKIENVRVPLAYRMIQTANLVNWQEGKQHDEFEKMLNSIAGLLDAIKDPKEENPSRNQNTIKQKEKKFTDPRDGQTYKTIELNGMIWMAENLNFEVEDSWVYEKGTGFLGLGGKEKVEKYGRLYTWEAAQKACPPGWRLPTDEEWNALLESFGGPKEAYEALMEGGSDSHRSGFAALLGGWRDTNGTFHSLGEVGDYWSGTQKDTQNAWGYAFYRYHGELYRPFFDKSLGLSCRCLQD